MDKLTIKTLAKELNLSSSTISKALRDSHEISVETKKKVLELARRLDFTPNPFASSLRKKQSKTIAVVIPEVANSFFAQAINGVESVAKEKGYHVMIYLTHENTDNERAILKDFENGRVDGVLMSVSRDTKENDHIKRLFSKDIPIVFFDRVFDDIKTVRVITDDYQSAYKATNHLLDCGCRETLFLSISNDLSIMKSRVAGYQHALSDRHIHFSNKNILNCSTNNQQNYELLKKRLQAKNKPCGVLASIENLSVTVYQLCMDIKLSIPKDLQVISYSNLDTVSILNPPMTTITQPAYEIGKTAASIMVKALDKKKFFLPSENIVIPSELIVRKSTSIK